ncbi:hypothetical protein F5Y19DRAFT_378621 [Xylariaceae sp. FL1651]|nr:hypothetical protein F5Y19DRAFT_378621 [Xylariaceae sp. FL1651]
MEYQQPPATTPSLQATAAPPPDTHIGRPVAAPPFTGTDIRSVKTACEFSLREYVTLLRRRRQQDGGPAGDGDDDDRLRAQAGIVVGDLKALRSEVSALLKTAEAGRWRSWLLGGFVASVVPTVRKVFRRRSSGDTEASNDTEHAFRKSKSLIARILDSVRHRKSALASLALFVLAVLYVFQREVSLRVARTVSKRLKKLVAKIERGEEGVGEEDIKVLNGWRWRVLLW